jgi:hypothetical protein
VLLDGVDGVLDRLGLAPHETQGEPARQGRLEPGQLALEGIEDRDGVRAGAFAHRDEDDLLAVDGGDRGRAGRDVAHLGDVGHADGGLARAGDHERPQARRIASAGPKAHRLARVAVDRDRPGGLDALALERCAEVCHGEAARLETKEIGGDLDAPRSRADEGDATDAVDRLERATNQLVGDGCELAGAALGRGRVARSREREERDRRVVGAKGLDARRAGSWRHGRLRSGHLFAHVVDGLAGVAVERELSDDDADTVEALRVEALERGHAAHGVLDSHRDGLFDLRGAEPRCFGGHHDERDLHVGEPIGAQPGEADDAEDDEGQHEHGGEHGATNGQAGEPLHERAPRGERGKRRPLATSPATRRSLAARAAARARAALRRRPRGARRRCGGTTLRRARGRPR